MKNIRAWVAFIAGAGFLVALMIYNANQPGEPNAHTSGDVWNENMTIGAADAPNVFVDYTDYFCSFCTDIYNAMGDQFKEDYVDTGKVRYEHRVVAVLQGKSQNTVQGAEAAYCAADQNKYWEYSADIIPRIKTDYFDKGIGVKNVANPVPIAKLPLSYFTTSAKNAGLDVDDFDDCMSSHKNEAIVQQNTKKAQQLGVNSLPFLVVNDYVSAGFSGGYDSVEYILKAGGVEK